jgi:two-component system, NarL family, sensor histidine kinase BarA
LGFLHFIQGILGDDTHRFSGEKSETITKEFFYKVLDTDPNPLLFFKKEEGWIGANKAFFDLVPLQNIEQLRNNHESIRDLFDHEDEEVFTEFDKSWLDYIRTHCPNGYGLGITDPSGKTHTLSATVTVVSESHEEVYLLRLEDQSSLVDLRAEVVKTEQLKSKFLANIGHEFRTPMNGILGFVELLSKTSPSETQIEYIHSVQSSARNLMSNIENLLDLAQMQNGRLSVSKEEFNIVFEMEELARSGISMAMDKGINALFFIDPKLPT